MATPLTVPCPSPFDSRMTEGGFQNLLKLKSWEMVALRLQFLRLGFQLQQQIEPQQFARERPKYLQQGSNTKRCVNPLQDSYMTIW